VQSLSRTYRGGSSPANRYADVSPEDVDLLLSSGKWKLVNKGPAAQRVAQAEVTEIPAPAADESFDPQGEEEIKIEATPAAIEEAATLSVDLSKVTGSLKGGRISVADVRAAAEESE
jgi:pyruvate/2-oxoglutarate dehydrogenase complex dihydrolipoamide acyltransferase (E2) component